MKLSTLLEALSNAHLKYLVLTAHEGGHIVLLERGARVIGVFPDDDASNQVWVNPTLLTAEAIDRYTSGTDWNIGGERTWFSPEIEYFIQDLKVGLESYRIQASFDPGFYRFEASPHASGTATWTQQTEWTAFRSRETVRAYVDKQIKLIRDPLKDIADETIETHYSYVGYELHTSISLEQLTKSASVSLWNLMQLPAGGEVLIPTYGRAQVFDFFAPTGPAHLDVSLDCVRFRLDCVRFRLDGAEQHKISLKAACSGISENWNTIRRWLRGLWKRKLRI